MSKKSAKEQQARYEVITQYDESSDDLLIPIPPQLLQKLGWKEGDDVAITLDEFGRYIFTKSDGI
jgi:hypothetical protein